MWYLISENNPDIKYSILGGKVYIVGRRDCDILVTGDASVSRKHSELSMSHTEANLTNTSRLPILRLKDLSKFGTWVNKQKVDGERILKDGDVIHFGSPSSSFIVVYEPLVLTTSCLDAAGKKSVRQTLCTLGGHMINEWKQDCAFLIMNKISVTIKVICAMVSLKPIVTPAYLEGYLKQLQGTGEKPDPDVFIPELAETQVDPSEVSFTANPRRKTVFQGKTFVFFSEKQLKKMSLAIELAGGMPILTDGKMDRQLLLGPDTVVMSCPDADITKDNQALVTKVTTLLQKNGKHLIPDAEIGYAVLYCSTEKHCNPDHIPEHELSRLPSQTLSQMDPFGVNTQSQFRGDTMKTQKEQHPPSQSVEIPMTKAVPQKERASSHIVVNETAVRKSRSALAAGDESMNTGTQGTVTVGVKEEPLSGRALTQRKGQKRQRVDEEEENETPIMLKRIKDEPVTPAPKQTKPVSKKQEPEPVWDSDEEVDYSMIDTDISVSKNMRSSDKPVSPVSTRPVSPVSTSRSVSPFRGKTKTTEKSKEIQQKSKSRSRSRSPVHSDHNPKLSGVTRSRSPADVNMQKTVSPRRSSSRSPKRIKEEQEDISEIVPKRGSRSSPARKVADKTKNKTSTDNEVTDVLSTKQENGENVVIKRDEFQEEELDGKSEVMNGDVPSGFLTTRKPIERQVKRSKNYEEDKDLPTACITVEFTSLLATKPQVSTNKDETRCPDGFTKWRGKIVKNFKKFKKSQHYGSQGLPNIIGGSDLEINQGQKSKEMDDWFKEALQAESQHTANDRRDKDLFDYNPTNTKRRGR